MPRTLHFHINQALGLLGASSTGQAGSVLLPGLVAGKGVRLSVRPWSWAGRCPRVAGGGRFIRAGPLLAPPCRGACHRPGATITLCHSTAAWLNPTEVGSHRRGPGSGSAGLRSFQKRRAGPACLSARWPRPPRHPLACGCIALISASRPVSSHRRLPCGHLCPHSFANLATSHVGSAPTLVTSSSLGYMCKHPVSA